MIIIKWAQVVFFPEKVYCSQD